MNREILGDWVVSGSKANCFADKIYHSCPSRLERCWAGNSGTSMKSIGRVGLMGRSRR